MSTTPILRDLFTTASEAQARAIALGGTGFRSYVIDGTKYYVPFSTYEQYERAIKFSENRPTTAARGDDTFGGNLVGLQFADTNNDQPNALMSLGNFSIETSVVKRDVKQITVTDSLRNFTVETLTTKGIDHLKTINTQRVKAKINFDKSQFDKYVRYGSLREKLYRTLQEIIKQFPAALNIQVNSIANPTVFNCNYNQFDNVSTFYIIQENIINPFNIDYAYTATTKVDDLEISELRNFGKQYLNYELYYNGKTYEIYDVALPTNSLDKTGFKLYVIGNPFSGVTTNKNANVQYYIKPNATKIEEFYNNISDLAAYLLNKKHHTDYMVEFDHPLRDAKENIILKKETLFFPKKDLFNIDVQSEKFDKYSEKLYTFGDDFDSYKSNLINRFLTSESLHEYDTEEQKINVIFESYGRLFDDVKKYADGLAYMTNVTYDKIDNIPDILLKNFANTIGWKTFTTNEDTLVEAIFDVKQNDQTTSTPYELDAELWRRIIINSSYLFKSKGTRKSIEFLLKLVGIPKNIIEINEYIYLADEKLDYNQYVGLLGNNIVNYPIDNDGYPTTPPNIQFQEKGGTVSHDLNYSGAHDYGKSYINAYEVFGNIYAYDLNKYIDNKKSWIYTGGTSERIFEFPMRDTKYELTHSELLINSKEIDAFLAGDRVFDYGIYKYFKKDNLQLNISGTTTTIYPNKITFNEYLRQVVDNFINVKNRKVIHKYPSLSKIYYDYLDLTNTEGVNQMTYKLALQFLSKFDTYWVKLVEQFVPATAILTAGKKVQNSVLTRNKYVYKHGLNEETNWLGTDGSEFQHKTLQPIYIGIKDGDENKTIYKASNLFNLNSFNSSITNKNDYDALIDRIGYYDVSTSSFLQYCATGGTITGITTGTTIIYECPPPLPHICYYDFGGETLPSPLLEKKDFNILSGTTGWSYSGTTGDVKGIISGSTLNLIVNDPSGTGFWKGIYNGSTKMYSGTTGNTNYFYTFDLYVSGTCENYIERPIFGINFFSDAADYKEVKLSDLTHLFRGGITEETLTFKGYFSTEDILNLSTKKVAIGVYSNTTTPSVGYHLRVSNFSIYKVNLSYIDQYGEEYLYKQPKYFGYSLNTGTTKPTNSIAGEAGAWIVPYIPVTAPYTGETIQGMYEEMWTRTKSDPLMHIEQNIVKYKKVGTDDSFIEFNLSSDVNLKYVFYNTTADTLTPDSVNIENKTFMSSALTYDFDGFYLLTESVNESAPGPFYIPHTNYDMYTITNQDIVCVKETDTYIRITNPYVGVYDDLKNNTGYTGHIPNDFNSKSESLSLIEDDGITYFRGDDYNLTTIEVSLICKTEVDGEQNVYVKLVDTNGQIYAQQKVIITGSTIPENIHQRTINVSNKVLHKKNDQIYLVIKPLNADLTILKEFTHDFRGTFELIKRGASQLSEFIGKETLIYGGDSYDSNFKLGNEEFSYMKNGYYDQIRFTAKDIIGTLSGQVPDEFLEEEYSFFINNLEGTATTINGRLSILNRPLERFQYATAITYYRGIRELPLGFTGLTWYKSDGSSTPQIATGLTGNIFTYVKNSYIRLYESDIFSYTDDLKNKIIAFFNDGKTYQYKDGYHLNYFDNAINRFYIATDKTTREIVKYGITDIVGKNNGIFLRYEFEKDLIGYPKTGEYIGRLTVRDLCGNFATIFILLLIEADVTIKPSKFNQVRSTIGRINKFFTQIIG